MYYVQCTLLEGWPLSLHLETTLPSLLQDKDCYVIQLIWNSPWNPLPCLVLESGLKPFLFYSKVLMVWLLHLQRVAVFCIPTCYLSKCYYKSCYTSMFLKTVWHVSCIEEERVHITQSLLFRFPPCLFLAFWINKTRPHYWMMVWLENNWLRVSM